MNGPSRTQYSGAIYRIYNRWRSSNIFLDDKDRQRFMKILEQHPKEINLILHMYAIRGIYL